MSTRRTSRPPGAAGSAPMPELAEPRRARILEIVNDRGSVRVSELVELVGAAAPTIRKDVAELDRHRLLRRTHGGALALASYEPTITERAERNVAAKTAIATTCASFAADGDAIYLDSGTTVQAIARALLARSQRPGGLHNVNVLTNAVGIAEILANSAAFRTTVLGGQLRPVGGCFVGPLALQAIEHFTVNLAFVAVSGLDNGSFCVADVAEAQVKLAVMARARRVVVAIDHTKLGAGDFVRLCSLERIDGLVTDEADPALSEACEAAGVELIVADR